jgi:hypothetical protein
MAFIYSPFPKLKLLSWMNRVVYKSRLLLKSFGLKLETKEEVYANACLLRMLPKLLVWP